MSDTTEDIDSPQIKKTKISQSENYTNYKIQEKKDYFEENLCKHDSIEFNENSAGCTCNDETQTKSTKSNNPHLVRDELFRFQKPGWRILKTTFAVFICLMISLIDTGDDSGIFHTFHACFAAIITLKSDLKHTWQAGLYRIGSTGFGALMGLITIQIRLAFNLQNNSVTYYLIITIMLFFTIWFTVLLNATEMTALAAVVFMLIALSQSTNPDYQPTEYAFILAFYRFLYTIIGILVANLVNWALPPYKKKKKKVSK